MPHARTIHYARVPARRTSAQDLLPWADPYIAALMDTLRSEQSDSLASRRSRMSGWSVSETAEAPPPLVRDEPAPRDDLRRQTDWPR